MYITFTGQGKTAPPRITDFPKVNFLNRDEVKGEKKYNEQNNNGFKFLCEATGENLEWTWTLNRTTKITDGSTFKVGAAGSLTGQMLLPEQSGNYQCFVEDKVSGMATFSRKVQVLVTCKSLHFTFLF